MSARSTLGYPESTGLIRQLDPGYFGALREIHHCKPVQAGELDENAACRTVGVCFERHGPHGTVEFNLPNRLLALEINDGGCLVFDRTADSVLAIRRDEYIVDAPVHGDALRSLQRSCVDHVYDSRLRPYAHQHPVSIFSNGNVVGAAAERHFPQNFPAPSIYHVEHALRFIADVDARPIGRESDAMRQFYATYHLHYFVCGGINHVDRIASAVRHIDPRYCSRRRLRSNSRSNTTHPFSEGKPVRVVR